MLKTTLPFHRDQMLARRAFFCARATAIRSSHWRSRFELRRSVRDRHRRQPQRSRDRTRQRRSNWRHDSRATPNQRSERQPTNGYGYRHPIPAMAELRGTGRAKITLLQPASFAGFGGAAIATFGAEV